MAETWPNAADNYTRFDGSRRGQYEVYYLKFNDVERRKALWLRYTLLAPPPGVGEPVCELWGVAFDAAQPSRNYGLKQTWPLDRLEFGREPFRFVVAGHELRHDGCHGELTGVSGRLAWDLSFVPDPLPTFRHFSNESLYRLPLPKTKVLAPNLSMRLSGEVTAFGRRWRMEDVPGHQAHIWGGKHAFRWAWANANVFKGVDEPVCFEALSAQVAVGRLHLPFMSLCALRIGAAEHRFNRIGALLTTRSDFNLERWNIVAEEDGYRIAVGVRNDPRTMVGVGYQDPDGDKRVCNNSKLADLELTLYRKTGRGAWEELRHLTAVPGTAAYEVVGPQAHPAVKVLIP